MSQDRHRKPEAAESFPPTELVLVLQRFRNLKRRQRVYLIEAVAGIDPDLLDDFLDDVMSILLREEHGAD